MMPPTGSILLTIILSAIGAPDRSATTQPAAAEDRPALRRLTAPVVDRALEFQAAAQGDDGGWPGPFGKSDPAITALVVKSFIQDPGYGPDHAVVRRAMRFVIGYQQDDGGIYDPEIGFRNYSTSVGLMMLAAADDPELAERVEAARGFLRANQWAEPKCDPDGRVIDANHPWYGGAGYGQHRRPDLSNTQMMLEALHQSGLPADDPTYQKALKFVLRCQMSERSNDQPFARGAADGGFVYTAAQGGESKAGTVTVNGRHRLRSYGSMTYAGFKSMLYADLARDDPRVRQAWDWIRRHYTLTANPNMPGEQSEEGLYYYYHVFARALSAWGEPIVVDADGRRHDWRRELVDRLLARQKPDGSWVNPADRWQEGNPHLVTAYAVLALQTAIR